MIKQSPRDKTFHNNVLGNGSHSPLSSSSISFAHSRRFPPLFSYPHNLPLTMPSTLSPRNTSLGFGTKFTDGCMPLVLRNAKEKPSPTAYFEQEREGKGNGKSFGISREQQEKQFVWDELLPQVGLNLGERPGPGAYEIGGRATSNQFNWTLTPRRKLFNSDIWIASKNACYTPRYHLQWNTKYVKCPIEFKKAKRVNNIMFRKNENPGPGAYEIAAKIGRKRIEDVSQRHAIANRRIMVGNDISETNRRKYNSFTSFTPRYANKSSQLK